MDYGNCTAHAVEMQVGLPEHLAGFFIQYAICGRTAGLESAIRIALAGQLIVFNSVNELTAYIA